MSQYDPVKAVNSPHHEIKPGKVSGAYTVEKLRGVNLPTTPLSGYLTAPANILERQLYNRLEQPGHYIRPPFKPVRVPERLPQSKQYYVSDDVATGLLRAKNGESDDPALTVNIHDIFKDNLLVSGRLDDSLEVAKRLEDSVGQNRRAAGDRYSGGKNPYKGITTNLTHPIVLGRMPGNIRIADHTQYFRRTGELPVVQNATLPNEEMTLIGGVVQRDTPMSYFMPGSVETVPHIGIGRESTPITNSSHRAFILGSSDFPINSYTGEDPREMQTTGTLRHEGIHAQQTTPITDTPKPDGIDDTELNLREVYNIGRPDSTYVTDNSAEALRAHKVLKDTYARHLINQGVNPESVVRLVQDPKEFLEFMNGVYHGGVGAGFSFPEGSVPAGMEEEVYRAANGFRPVVGELKNLSHKYNSWQSGSDQDYNKFKHHTPNAEAVRFMDTLPFPALFRGRSRRARRLEKFNELHPQVRNNTTHNDSRRYV
jgi:hypothetical protein